MSTFSRTLSGSSSLHPTQVFLVPNEGHFSLNPSGADREQLVVICHMLTFQAHVVKDDGLGPSLPFLPPIVFPLNSNDPSLLSPTSL